MYPGWSALPRPTSPSMQVYVPVKIPLAFNSDGLLVPAFVNDRRRSSEYRRSGDERRSSDHRSHYPSNDQEKDKRRSSRREHREPRHSGNPGNPGESSRKHAQPASHHEDEGDVRSQASRTRSRSRARPHQINETPVRPETAPDHNHNERESRNKARLTLHWVRALVPGIPPPSYASPPVSPAVHLSPPPSYFHAQHHSHSTQHTLAAGPHNVAYAQPTLAQRPTYRRQSSLQDYMRKLTPGRSQTRHPAHDPGQPSSAGKILDSVALACAESARRVGSVAGLTSGGGGGWRPRKVRFADGGVPGAGSGVG